MLTLESLGRLVAKKRGDRGIRAAASEIGISPSTLSRVENGHLPDLENYRKICAWLGIDPANVVGTHAAGAVGCSTCPFQEGWSYPSGDGPGACRTHPGSTVRHRTSGARLINGSVPKRI